MSDPIERAEYDEPVRRYLALRSKLGLLEATVSADTLGDDDEYNRYQEQLETLSDDIEDVSDAAGTALEKMEPPNTQ